MASNEVIHEGTFLTCMEQIKSLVPEDQIVCRADMCPQAKPIQEAIDALRDVDRHYPAKLMKSYQTYGKEYVYVIVSEGYVVFGTTTPRKKED